MATKSSWSQFLIGLLFVCSLATTIRAVQITEDGEENEHPKVEEKMETGEKMGVHEKMEVHKEDPDVFVSHNAKEFVQKLDKLMAQSPVEKKAEKAKQPTQADYAQLLQTFFQRNVHFLEALEALAKAMVPHHKRYANLTIFDEKFHMKCRISLNDMKLALHASKSIQIIPAHFEESAKFLKEITLPDSSALNTAMANGENQEMGKAVLQMRKKMNKFLQKFAREAQMARMFMELGKCFIVLAASRQHDPAVSPQEQQAWRAHGELRDVSQQLCGLLHDIVYMQLLNSVAGTKRQLPAQKSVLLTVWGLGERNVPDNFNEVLALMHYGSAERKEIVEEMKEKLVMPVEWKKAEEARMDAHKKPHISGHEAQIRLFSGLALVTYYNFRQQFPNSFAFIKPAIGQNSAVGQNKAAAVAVAAHNKSIKPDQKKGHLSPAAKQENDDVKNEEAEMKKEKKDDI